MTDVIVAPHREGWTVRHPRRLHEHFASRGEALRRAAAYARQLSRDGPACEVREGKSFSPAGARRER